MVRAGESGEKQLCQNPEIRGLEVCDIRENRWQTRRAYTEPLRQRGPILVDRRRRNHNAGAGGVVCVAQRKRWELSEELPALDPGADDEMMVAPGMIGSGAVGCQGTSELGSREGGYVRIDGQFLGRPIERQH